MGPAGPAGGHPDRRGDPPGGSSGLVGRSGGVPPGGPRRGGPLGSPGGDPPGGVLGDPVGTPSVPARVGRAPPVGPRGVPRGGGDLSGSGPRGGSPGPPPSGGSNRAPPSLAGGPLGGLGSPLHPRGPPGGAAPRPGPGGGHLGPGGSSPSPGGGHEPGRPPPRGGSGQDRRRPSRGHPLGPADPGSQDPPGVRSAWRGVHPADRGVLPGRGWVWSSQVGTSLVVPGPRGWTPQASREYYLTGPVGLFVRHRPPGRPGRAKWARRPRRGR